MNPEGTHVDSHDENPEGEHETIQYVDKKGMVHHFKSTAELAEFREEENNPDNR
jgi:hypothetical protein